MFKKTKRHLAFLMSALMMLTFSFSDGLLGLSSLVYAEDGSEESSNDITGKAVEPANGDGSAEHPFEIKNYDNLIWFQEYVDAGNYSASAILVDDIIANKNLLNESGELKTDSPEYPWIPIAKASGYKGIFDGNGYSISGLYYSDNYSSDAGLFADLRGTDSENLGTIKNLIIKDSYFCGSSQVGSFAGNANSNSLIENCGSTATIFSKSSYSGGIAAQQDGTGLVKNCFFAGKISNQGSDVYSDAIKPLNKYNTQYVENCYYLDTCGLSSKVGISKTAEDFSSGEVCFLLNNKKTDSSIAWYQSLTSDSYPVLNKGGNLDTSKNTVYKSYNKDEKKIYYSNTAYSCDTSEHAFEKGICQICDLIEVPELVDGFYQLKNYGHLVWFQKYVDAGHYNVNAKLIDNIVANDNLLDSNGDPSKSPEYNWTPIAQSPNNYDSAPSVAFSGIFDGNGYSISGLYYKNKILNSYYPCGLFGNSTGTIKNLIIKDSYFYSDTYSCSFIGNAFSSGKVENCGSFATIEYGNGCCSGIAWDASSIENCFFAGDLGTYIYYSGITNDTSTVKNCYYLSNNGGPYDPNYKYYPKSLSAFQSGEVCYLLNNGATDGTQAFYQTLGTDDFPCLKGGSETIQTTSTVYKAYDSTEGKIKYQNAEYTCGEAHPYDTKGICEICGAGQEPTTDTDGVYQIANYGNLIWFSQFVNAGNTSANASLTADITANSYLLSSDGSVSSSKTPDYVWAPISQNDWYTGTFNGNGHFISGLYFNDSSKDIVGLFGKLEGTIKNLIIKDSYFKGNSNVGSFAGMSEVNGLIENCGSLATVIGSNSGGIRGVTYGKIKNCYYMGKISGSDKLYPIGDYDFASDIYNCYYSSDSFTGSTSDISTPKAPEAFSSGEVCFLLNKRVTDGSQSWYQTLGTDSYPILNPEEKASATVYKYYDEETQAKGYRNEEYICSHEYENDICKKCDDLFPAHLFGGAYQIYSYGQLLWFQEYVEDGNFDANATLQANITVNENLNAGESPKYIWSPICQNGSASNSTTYRGTFDGNGHFISGLYFNNSSADNVGLFGVLSGTVKNLIIKDSYFKGNSNVGSFAGLITNDAKIENCSSSATVIGSISCGGIAGYLSSENCEISNCCYIGNISYDPNYASDSDAIADHSYDTITNCYYLSSCGATSSSSGATSKTADKLGEICEAIGNHSYAGEKCLVCKDADARIVPIYNLDVYSDYNNLGLAFCMQINDETANTTGSSIKVTLPDKTTKIYPIKDAKKLSLSFTNDGVYFGVSGKEHTVLINDEEKEIFQSFGLDPNSQTKQTLYIFPLDLAPWELTQEVKAELISGGESIKTFKFTATNNIENERLWNYIYPSLTSNLLNYATATQIYYAVVCAYDSGELAKGEYMRTTPDEDTISYFESHSKAMVSNEKIGTFTGLDVVLGSSMTLNAYFKPAEGVDISDLTFTVDETSVPLSNLKQSGDKYILSVENIGIKNIKNLHSFKASNGSDELSLEDCNIFTYIGCIFKSTNTYDTDLIALLSDLSAYSDSFDYAVYY